MNILIPCAGRGSRFAQAGYDLPKPLIDVYGKPMIARVIENIGATEHRHIILVQTDHWNANSVLFHESVPQGTFIKLIDEVTEGAACTALLASDLIDNDEPLFMANSDQMVLDWDMEEFLDYMDVTNADGGIVTFEATESKWSYARTDALNGNVLEVAEKRPISTHATVGFYYWKHGRDFVKYAKQMIARNIRTNNEFYVAPVFNEALRDNKNIISFDVLQMYGIGTPEDLTHFLSINS